MEVPKNKPPTGLSSPRRNISFSKSDPAFCMSQEKHKQCSAISPSRDYPNFGGKSISPIPARSSNSPFLDPDSVPDLITSSDQLKDAFFKEWSERKKRERRLSVKEIHERKLKEEKAALEKKEERQEKNRKSLEKWTHRKDVLIKEKLQERLRQEEEIKLMEEDAKQKKIVDNELACKAWVQVKNVKLKEINQQRKANEQRETEKKKEEMEQKRTSSQQAFEAWAARKKSIISAERKKENLKNAEILTEQLSLEQRKKVAALSAFQSWKEIKDKQIKTRAGGKLYTYNPNPREPPKSSKWCPARSVKYDYPSLDKVTAEARPNCLNTSQSTTTRNLSNKVPSRNGIKKQVWKNSSPLLDETYSLDDFESDKESVEEDVVEDITTDDTQ